MNTQVRAIGVFLQFGLSVASLLSGCGAGSAGNAPIQAVAFTGQVRGGQHPVAHANVQMYSAGHAGSASAATPLLLEPVESDANGLFSIPGDYTCANAADQVYIVASGGSPGLLSGTSNKALVMFAALGDCSTLTANSFITINEVTTVAAAWAISPFMTSYTNVGASATNTSGLANAFLDAQLLADPGTGLAAKLPYNLTVQTDKLYALANAIASCVNSDGTTACTPLFTAATPTNGSEPSNTLEAALDIVRHPGQNPVGVWQCVNTSSPFPTALTQAPNDWTMSLVVTGGGLSSPTSLDVDQLGNVWVADEPGALSEFSPQGTPLSGATGFGVGDLYEVFGLAIDTNGFIWVSNEQSSPNGPGSLAKFYGSNSSTPGAVVNGNGGTNFYDSTISFPVALSSDSNGNILIDNYAPYSSVTVYNDAGAYVSNLAAGSVAYPIAIAPDLNHGAWIANYGDSTITHSDSNGNILGRPTCCDNANGLATDASGNVWVTNYSVGGVGSFSEVSASGTVLISRSSVGGVQHPAGVHIDAAQNVWIANYRGESISEVAGGASALAAGTAISPTTGFGYSGASSNASLLLLPYDLVPDASGDLWVSDYGNNTLVMFFGLAAPTVTPVRPIPAAP